MQPLNKSKVRGWFIQESDFESCKWNATEDDFEKGSALFGYKHVFGQGDKTKEETGINFIQPRIQIILRSPLMIEETSWPSTTIGSFQDPEAKELWEADKAAAAIAASKKDTTYKRKYQARTKYLINILKKDNTPAHEIPIVLTIKGLNGSDISDKITFFQDEMGKCLSKALGREAPVKYNEKFFCTTVFVPTLVNDIKGKFQNDICSVESFDAPDYSTQEAAVESLHRLTIPDEARELAWDQQQDKWYKQYINKHYAQDAKNLGGGYGLKPGLNILPQGMDDAKAEQAIPVGAGTGEDTSL